MVRNRQLLVFWDPELDGVFRRRLERAFGDLNVAAADASAVDIDPDAPAPIRLALLSAAGSPPVKCDIVVQAGPGDFPRAGGILRLETSDIEDRTRRWTALIDQLRVKLGRASLALPPEDLEIKLDDVTRRAEEAERGLADMERQRNDALRAARQAQTSLVAERARFAELEQETERLRALTELTVFTMSSVPPSLHDTLAQARDHAWRARLVAARADEAAAAHPEALAFPKVHATYSGETRNRLPHGFGVMTFSEGVAVIASYRGAFENGQRTGHGVAASDGGLLWFGEWRDNEASGFGILETPDGQRFEGEVAPDEGGAPKRIRGWAWDPGELYYPVPPLLPSPAEQTAGG